MVAYFAPVALVVLSNIFYHICAKSVPDEVSPFAVLTVTYLVGALCSTLIFFFSGGEHDFFKELTRMNWSPYLLGIVIVGLEVGVIYAYKVGWQVSTENIVQSALVSVALIFVGVLLYKEPLTWNRLVGAAICLVGLVFINLK